MIKRKLLIAISFVAVILYINHEYGFVNFNNHVMIEIRDKASNLQSKNDIKVLEYNRKKHNFSESFLRINGKKIKIFTHGSIDIISRRIIENGIWEGEWLNQLLRYMGLFPKIQLLDFGCNMGVHTLTAAAHGYKVLAVDANSNNTDRIVQSVIENNFQRNVVVVLNALSDVKQEFSMIIHTDNVGGQPITNSNIGSYKVKSVFIDELLPLVDENLKVVIKMDIEGSEVSAMKMAAGLFNKRHVVALFMEWLYIRMRPDIGVLIDFLIKRNYRPYKDFFSTIELNIYLQTSWPGEVVWRKIS